MTPLLPLLSLLTAAPAEAAGYDLFKLEGRYGSSEQGAIEAGFGLFVVSDQLGFWLTLGEKDAGGRGRGSLLKEWWLEGSWFGYQLGIPPVDELKLDKKRIVRPTLLFPYGWARFGQDRTTGRLLAFEGSQHLAMSIPGAWDKDARLVHFGPTAGFGLHLGWWDQWRDISPTTVATGKVTAEAGWIAGASWREILYGQARFTGRYDLFGVHQTAAGLAGVAGFFLGPLGEPLGLELKGELDVGNDNVHLANEQTWRVQVVLYIKADTPRAPAALPDQLEIPEIPPEPPPSEAGRAESGSGLL